VETTVDPGADQRSGSGKHSKNDANDNVSELKAAAVNEIKSLIADVEDLIERIADLKDTDVVRVRTKVLRAVNAAKEGLAEGADTVRRQAQKTVSEADGYVRENPWAAVGVAALVGAVVGILVARRS
jgi:ElaB/YqjD/DUF883 family membrane-anchored ribosome-binding protein